MPQMAQQTKFVQRRRYWRMQCTDHGVHLNTTAIDSNNQLRIEEDKEAAVDQEDAIGGYRGATLYSEERLSQEIEQSSQSVPANLPKDVKYKSSALRRVLSDTDIKLSGEQKAVLDLVLNTRKNVFFTGAAGTGKSVLLRCMIELLREKHGRKQVFITAPTGIAACNVGGTTLHRWAGVGLGDQPIDQLVKRVMTNKKTKDRWLKTRVLFIDEVSMVSAPLLTKLEEIARHVRKSPAPFGGIQIICTGDLFQLPPIDRNDSRFCFETEVWDRIIHRTVNLTQVFRQKDPKFANVLNEIRMGHVSEEASQLMARLSRPPKMPKGLVPTSLFPTRLEVSNANESALSRIVGTAYEYMCQDWKKPTNESKFVDIAKHTIAEPKITLKVGAQVMLIKNLDDTLVNGSIGRVVGFMTSNMSMASVDRSHDRRSVEKILGISSEKANVSESIKRKRTLAEHVSNEAALKTAVLPVVKFVTPNNTVRFLMVQPETWEILNTEGEVIASRTQVPLILAWALSVHKSQGQTLPYVSVNLGRVFEYGQAYVAVSRATSTDGLQVTNFSPSRITASKVVTEFYKRLPGMSDIEIKEAEKNFAAQFVEEDSEEDGPEDSSSENEMVSETSQEDEAETLKTEIMPLESPNQLLPSHPLGIEFGDADDNMFSDIIDDDIDNVKNSIYQSHDEEVELPRKRARMIMSSSPPQHIQ